MIKPSKLQPGDTVVTISLSWGGAQKFSHRYLAGKGQLQEVFGVNVVESRHGLKDQAWLARNPQARAEDLMEAFPIRPIKPLSQNLAVVGVLERLGGILFGRPGGAIAEAQHLAYDEAIRQVVSEEYGLISLPIITNMDFGHTDPIMVLPYGLQAELDCEQQTFTILESAVAERINS